MNELDARLTRRYVTKVILYILLSVLLYVLTTARGTVVSARLAALDADPAWAFCRAEVTDVTRSLRIALGNPIWNRA